MDDAPIESTKERRRNGRPPNAPESYCRSRATIDNTPESRKSLGQSPQWVIVYARRYYPLRVPRASHTTGSMTSTRQPESQK